MQKLTDLRFIIGLFFSVTGLIVLLNYFVVSDALHPELNLYSGAAMLVFGLVMLIFYNRGNKENA